MVSAMVGSLHAYRDVLAGRAVKRILVTGGAGFIGSRCAELALARGFQVVILDDLSTGLKSRLDDLVSKGAEAIVGDLRDDQPIFAALDGVDAVVHLGAQVSVPKSIEDPQTTRQINVDGTRHLAEAMDRRGINRLVLASSAAVYGDVTAEVQVEEKVGKRLSPYADSKWENEILVEELQSKGREAIALRFFNVYGHGQRSDGAYAAVIPAFVDRMMRGLPPTIYGDGGQTRDFVHVDDVARLLLDLATEPWPSPQRRAYNVATGTGVTLLELVRLIRSALHTHGLDSPALEPVFDQERPGDIRKSIANVSAISEDIRWNASVSLQQGITAMIDERLAGV